MPPPALPQKAYYGRDRQAPYFVEDEANASARGETEPATSSATSSPDRQQQRKRTPLRSTSSSFLATVGEESAVHHQVVHPGEADAAAGASLTQRVSSLSNLLTPHRSRTGSQQQQQQLLSNHSEPRTRNARSVSAGSARTQRTSPSSLPPPSPLGGSTHPRGESASTIMPSPQAGAILPAEPMMTIIQPDWRLKDRMKTVGVGLVLALNIGTDPPDVTKPSRCAVMQCWIDPLHPHMSRAKAKEWIGERLERQYQKWQFARGQQSQQNRGGGQQPRSGPGGHKRSGSSGGGMKYRKALDPTVDDVRTLCCQLRRQARQERVLFHYNGHGVPRPTAAGELWVFDKNHTEYIPLPVSDLLQWLGKPSIVVLDCSSAGILLPFLTSQQNEEPEGTRVVTASPTLQSAASATARRSGGNLQQSGSGGGSSAASASSSQASLQDNWVRDVIVLCPCSAGEWLPMNPEYPADIFTSCLTTPIHMAVRWFILQRNNQSNSNVEKKSYYSASSSSAAAMSIDGLDPDAVHSIPGTSNDRKTPLGELNWIFTAVTDSIAWNILPKPLFQRLFRQDLMVASLFRNFLLAHRILKRLNCTPQSYPPLPPECATHPLWQAFDLACETLLFQLVKEGVLKNPAAAANETRSKKDEDRDDADGDTVASGSGGENESTMAEPRGPTSHALAELSKTTGTPTASPRSVNIQQWSSSWVSSPFFSEQLTAFEVWLDFAPVHKMQLESGCQLDSPEQLPIVLQVLLSQVHRIRALVLLRRFLDLGPWAVNLALSLGIFPYVMKLLQSVEYKSLLVSIWASILSFDPSCRVDLLKDGAFHHFVQHLMFGLSTSGGTTADVAQAAKERTLAAFVLAAACHEYPAGQAECVRLQLHGNCCALLSSYEQGEHVQDDAVELHLPAHFRLWVCLCLGNMFKDNSPMQAEAYLAGVHSRLFVRIHDVNPDVRAAVCYALGCLIGSRPKKGGMGSRTPSSNQLFSPTSQQQSLQGSSPSFQGVPPQLLQQRLAGVAGVPGQLQPNFGPGVGPGNPQWTPQQLAPLPGVPPGAQPIPTAPISLRSPSGQPLMVGQPMQSAPPNFFLGGAPVTVGQGRAPPQLYHQQPQQQPTMTSSPGMRPNVFEDQHRLELDLSATQVLVEALHDASVVVRYEATVALAGLVGKYQEGFLMAAEELTKSAPPSPETPSSRKNTALTGQELDRKMLDRLIDVWKSVRSLRLDPFPPIAKAAKQICGVVNEAMLAADVDRDTSREVKPDLRRVTSELTAGQPAAQSPGTEMKSRTAPPSQYSLPKSRFYAWKKEAFVSSVDADSENLDPLSPAGAARVYQARRNDATLQAGGKLEQRFEALAPKPPKPRQYLVDVEEDIAEEEEAALASLKKELEVVETRLLLDKGVKMTAMVSFHPFEDVVMTCSHHDLSLWRTTSGDQIASFANGNSKETRMTTSAWLNTESEAKFLTGSNDGTVRVWDRLLESNGEPCNSPPSIVSAFTALPMKPERGGSGLVCEWQETTGSLFAGGNSRYVRVFDIESEQQRSNVSTNSAAYVTTLSSSWHDGQGISPHVLVAGRSDGVVSILDTRTSREQGESPTRRRHGPTEWAEHKSWVVSTQFTSYAGRHELISGSVDGTVKAFDMRMSSSVRTVKAQRSTMTALAVHSKVPVLATGSDAQFIKLLTLDGETVQVLRYHGKGSSHRIGPVSCLAFHPYKPLLAAGATDAYVSLYSPKSKYAL